MKDRSPILRPPRGMGHRIRGDDAEIYHSLTGGSDGSQLQQGRSGVSRGSAGLLQGQRAAGDAAEAGQEGRHLGKDEMVDWWRILNKKGWGVSHWPKEYGGTGWTLGAALHLQRGTADGAGAGAARLRRQHGRPGDLHLRQRGAEEAVSAAHRQCRRLVVPGLLRARLGLRPRLAQDQGRAQGRQVHRQRPEDLDHAGAARRHDLLPVPHRPRGQEADRHLLHPDRHEDQGHHGAADPDHRRRPRGQRGVLRRRRGAGREPGRRGEQGLGLRQIPARQRAHRHRPRRRLQGAHPPHQGAGLARSSPAASR